MVYGMDSKQQEVYDECGFSLVENVIEGYNGTMFAYGQTGCGKTHTMMGPSNPKGPEFVAEEDRGIIPKVIRHIFNFIDGADKDTKFLVRCSYLEIYNEKVLDLLNLSKEQEGLQIKEDPTKGPYVKDLTTVITKTVNLIQSTWLVVNAKAKPRPLVLDLMRQKLLMSVFQLLVMLLKHQLMALHSTSLTEILN